MSREPEGPWVCFLQPPADPRTSACPGVGRVEGVLTCAGHVAGILGGAVVASVAAALRGSGVGGGAVLGAVTALGGSYAVLEHPGLTHCGENTRMS